MKRLKDILVGFDFEVVQGGIDQSVDAIHFDSRLVSEGTVFIAIPGVSVDGHDFIDSAIEKGCRCIIAEKPPENSHPDLTLIRVKDSSQVLSLMASLFYNSPSHKIKLVGITGTNGKTTTATLLHDLYTNLGYKCGLISTVTNKIANRAIKATHTTPDPISLISLFNDMLEEGCTHCSLEVSSHAIV